MTYLIRVVGEVNFVEDLRRLVLDGLDFHLMRRILSLSVAECLLQPLKRVGGDGMASRTQEQRQFLVEKDTKQTTNKKKSDDEKEN